MKLLYIGWAKVQLEMLCTMSEAASILSVASSTSQVMHILNHHSTP